MEKAWQEIAARCPKDRPIRGAEVGVWFGSTSSALLHAIPNLYLCMIDWYKTLATPKERNRCSVKACIGQSEQQMCDALRGATEATNFASERRTILIMESINAAKWVTLNGTTFHFAFLDADHTYEGTLAAIRAYWPLIEPGGFLCGHDYGHPSPDWGVAEAVHEFADEVGLPVALGCDGFWCMNKPKGET